MHISSLVSDSNKSVGAKTAKPNFVILHLGCSKHSSMAVGKFSLALCVYINFINFFFLNIHLKILHWMEKKNTLCVP
jgi:hypothetical protein